LVMELNWVVVKFDSVLSPSCLCGMKRKRFFFFLKEKNRRRSCDILLSFEFVTSYGSYLHHKYT
jgi:hypothetical protein